MKVPTAQAILLAQLKGASRRAVEWHQLSGHMHWLWLHGKRPPASSANHPLFTAASQALAGDVKARDFWNKLADTAFMGTELGVQTVYSRWIWMLWAIAAHAFRLHGWSPAKIDLQLERFAVLSALSAEVSGGYYDGGELSHLRGAVCRGEWLCLPWGKRGFARTGPRREGPASHVWDNFQGYMLMQACGVPARFDKPVWDKECMRAIGPDWHRLSPAVQAEIKAWINARDPRVLRRLEGLKTQGPEAVVLRTVEGVSVALTGRHGTGRMGTQQTLAATYRKRSKTLHVLTAGDGKRSGQLPAAAVVGDGVVRRRGGSPSPFALPKGGDEIPWIGGKVVARIVITRQGVSVNGAAPPPAVPAPVPPRPVVVAPPRPAPTSTTSWQTDMAGAVASLNRALPKLPADRRDEVAALTKRLRPLVK